MDDFGKFARDLGYKPQGKSAPMKSSGIGSDRSPSVLFSDDQFSDVFGGPPKYSSTSTNNNNMSDFDYDSIFKASKNEAKSKLSDPVYDKPVYDDDIFDGLPGLKSKSVSTSNKFEENVFANISSPPKRSSGDHFDDLLGNLNRREKGEPKNKNIGRTASDFDDLLPGFGSSSSPTNRPIPESNQTSKVTDDPFVVLESTSTPGVSFFSDPLEEISKLSKSGNPKESKSSVSTRVSDDIDPLHDFGKYVPAHSSGMKNSGKDESPSRVRSSMKKTQESASTEAFGIPSFKTYTERSSQKKVPVDDSHESHQTFFEMPAASTESQKPIGQQASSPPYGNVNIDEANSQADTSFRTEEHTQSSDDAWLTVSEIPLFTQPTKAPPPSRPPPPIPRHTSKSERAFSASNARHKGNDFSPPSSAQYSQSHNPFRSAPKNPVVTSIDELDEFAVARNYNNFNENDNSSTNSAAAAAMKDAVDRAEAKLKNAKEVREREHAKAARSKESVQREKDEQDVLDEEIGENQERLNRERQQREEEEREQRRLEKERAREIEREKARQAVERATREARERAAAEARERAAADARLKSERAAVQRAQAEARSRAAAEARERAERVAAEARERANAEAREKEAKEKDAVARAEAEARRRAERAAVDRVAAAARERAAAEARDKAAARTSQQKNDNDLESFFNMSSRPNSAPRHRGPSLDPQFQNRRGADGTRRSSPSEVTPNMKKAMSTTNIVDDLSSIFGAAPSNGDFQDVEGETEERRRARLERHQRTQERAAKAVAEKNQRDLQLQKDQEERSRIAETLDIEIKRWAAGKEGNLRALLSTLQYVLWPECGWQPVSLTDLIMGASVKKVYRKATLCIHPDKVQQKGANIQQKYIAEKVFDLLKEAWNKFNSEELF